ncbi:MAG: Crp/Fnr family transcriptional regulator [bacterium]|jgi:CRP-like cAMP-binding protein
MPRCHNCPNTDHVCARTVPIFSSLNPAGLLELNSLIEHREYQKGELLFSQGDPGSYLYIVRSGRIKLYTVSVEGRQQILRILEQGDFFGELALFQNTRQSCYAEAMDSSGICLLPQQGFKTLLREKPEIALSLLDAMSARLAQAEEFISDLTLKNVEERLVSWLLVMAQKGVPTSQGVRITLDLTREELAHLLGTTIETVSRRLNALQTEGIIKRQGHRTIFITDISKLESL